MRCLRKSLPVHVYVFSKGKAHNIYRLTKLDNTMDTNNLKKMQFLLKRMF